MQEAPLQQPTIKLGRIKLGRNPRTYFDDAKMAEMKASISTRGVDTPVIVRPIDGGFFELIAGGRRYKAALETHGAEYDMPVNVKDVDEVEAEEIAFIENIQRDDMSPGDEAVEAARLLGRCQGDREEAARRIGWSVPTLNSRLALLNCSSDVLVALNTRQILLGQPIYSLATVVIDENPLISELLDDHFNYAHQGGEETYFNGFIPLSTSSVTVAQQYRDLALGFRMLNHVDRLLGVLDTF